MAENVLKTLNVLNGCIHFEAKSSSKGPMPIEINLRMGGDEVYSFVENAWGVNLVEFAVKIALGEKIIINKPTVPKMRLEGRYFLPEKEGRIKKITVSNLVLNNPNILEVHLSKNKNDTITLPPKDFDYLGWITAKGETPEQAHKNLEESFSQIKFSVN